MLISSTRRWRAVARALLALGRGRRRLRGLSLGLGGGLRGRLGRGLGAAASDGLGGLTLDARWDCAGLLDVRQWWFGSKRCDGWLRHAERLYGWKGPPRADVG